MPSVVDQLFEDVAAPLEEEFYGVSIIYARDGISSAPLTAIPETLSNPVLDIPDPHSTTSTLRNYTIKATTLIVGGNVIEPAVGDQITETIGGVSQVFRLMPTDDRPVAELLQGGFRWLVHTKRVI